MISVDNLSVSVGDKNILNQIAFDLPKNGFLAILGPNGGGKSTLIRCVLGLQDYQGRISFADGSAATSVVTRGATGNRHQARTKPGIENIAVGYVPQIKTLDRTFPARAGELVATALYKKWPWRIGAANKVIVEEALQRVGVGHLCHQQIRNLSGGELQRVYLARAIIGNPQILILDEPSAGVDLVGASDLLEIVESYRKDTEATVIMVTHDWEVAFHHASHVLVLKTSQVSFGPADEALTESAIREAFGHVGHSHGVLSGGHHHG